MPQFLVVSDLDLDKTRYPKDSVIELSQERADEINAEAKPDTLLRPLAQAEPAPAVAAKPEEPKAAEAPAPAPAEPAAAPESPQASPQAEAKPEATKVPIS